MGLVGIMYEKGDIIYPSVEAALDAQCIDLSCLHRPAEHRSVFVITNPDTDIGKKYGGMEMTAIDGKAICGMTDRDNGGKPRYYMNAQKSSGTISVRSREVGEKKNELPGFISSLCVEENIDAIGTQKAVIDKTTSAKTSGKWEKTGRETMYYITDLTNCNSLTLLECKIDHRCIEASHWKLDVIMREGFQRARKENAGINMTAIRRLVMRIRQASGNPKDKKLKYFIKHCFKDNNFMLKCILMSG